VFNAWLVTRFLLARKLPEVSWGIVASFTSLNKLRILALYTSCW